MAQAFINLVNNDPLESQPGIFPDETAQLQKQPCLLRVEVVILPITSNWQSPDQLKKLLAAG